MPEIKCPLKAAALMANPNIASLDASKVLAFTKCDRDACGFWSKVEYAESKDEACSLSLLPRQLSDATSAISEVYDALTDEDEESGERMPVLADFAAGMDSVAGIHRILRVAAEAVGARVGVDIGDMLNKIEEAELAGDDEEGAGEDDGELEPEDSEEEVEADAE